MPQARWQAAADGRYWVYVALGRQELAVMVDLGLVDPTDRVGFEVEPGIYNALKQGGQLSRFTRRSRRDASGQIAWFDTGVATAQLIDPVSRQRMGPVVSVWVACGAAGVPSRVGVVFFHHLTKCEVLWELDQRTWEIRCP
jgi:hypothetical protein